VLTEIITIIKNKIHINNTEIPSKENLNLFIFILLL
jgi:hypothetical protein